MVTILTASPPPAGPVHAESTSTPRVQETPPTLAKMASLHLPAGRGWAPTASWLSLCGGWLQGRGLAGAPTKTRHVQEREGAVVTLAQQIRGTVFFFKKQKKGHSTPVRLEVPGWAVWPEERMLIAWRWGWSGRVGVGGQDYTLLLARATECQGDATGGAASGCRVPVRGDRRNTRERLSPAVFPVNQELRLSSSPQQSPFSLL